MTVARPSAAGSRRRVWGSRSARRHRLGDGLGRLAGPASTSRRMSFIGSTERTRGTTSKLFSGGGDQVNHSSVLPFHGSFPARLPCLIEWSTLTTVTITPIAEDEGADRRGQVEAAQPASAG